MKSIYFILESNHGLILKTQCKMKSAEFYQQKQIFEASLLKTNFDVY